MLASGVSYAKNIRKIAHTRSLALLVVRVPFRWLHHQPLALACRAEHGHVPMSAGGSWVGCGVGGGDEVGGCCCIGGVGGYVGGGGASGGGRDRRRCVGGAS